MKLWQIAWKSIEHRRLASGLTAFSMSLGVALVVTVIVLYGVLSASFNRSAQGYDLIVGPKGSPLVLVLSTMFYAQDQPGVIPYDYYKQLSTGRYSPEVAVAVPVALGEHYKGCPVVGTTPDFFDKLEYRRNKPYIWTHGRNLDAGDEFCAVLGSTAARRLKREVGDTFTPPGSEKEFKIIGVFAPTQTPNDTAIFVYLDGFFKAYETTESGLAKVFKSTKEFKGEGQDGGLDIRYKETRISAVLVKTKERDAEVKTTTDIWGAKPEQIDPSGNPNIPQNVERKHVEDAERIVNVHIDQGLTQSVIDQSVLALPIRIGNDLDAQAVHPIDQIAWLLERVVGNMQLVLIILAVLVVVVAGIGMMVSIYNSMNERRQEIAIMRALGARRTTVMGIILLESILLSLGGGVLGMVIGHGLIALIGPAISAAVNIGVSPLEFRFEELVLVPGLILLASIVGSPPAVVAYRTDVAQSLAP